MTLADSWSVLNARISNYSFDIEVVACFAEGGFDLLCLDRVAHSWAKLLALVGHIKLTLLLLHLKREPVGMVVLPRYAPAVSMICWVISSADNSGSMFVVSLGSGSVVGV